MYWFNTCLFQMTMYYLLKTIIFLLGASYGLSEQGFRPSFAELSGINYICQYCLVHLGDIARYRHQLQQAETFYRQAILLAPGSAHAYNQVCLYVTIGLPLLKMIYGESWKSDCLGLN